MMKTSMKLLALLCIQFQIFPSVSAYTFGGPVSVALTKVPGSQMCIIFPGVESRGRLVAWEYYANATGTFWCDIWREISPGTHQLIHKTRMDVASTGYHRVDLPMSEQTDIQPGDKIGHHFASGGISIPITTMGSPCCGFPQSIMKRYASVSRFQANLALGYTTDITDRGPRSPSYRAVISTLGAVPRINLLTGPDTSAISDALNDGQLNTCEAIPREYIKIQYTMVEGKNLTFVIKVSGNETQMYTTATDFTNGVLQYTQCSKTDTVYSETVDGATSSVYFLCSGWRMAVVFMHETIAEDAVKYCHLELL